MCSQCNSASPQACWKEATCSSMLCQRAHLHETCWTHFPRMPCGYCGALVPFPVYLLSLSPVKVRQADRREELLLVSAPSADCSVRSSHASWLMVDLVCQAICFLKQSWCQIEAQFFCVVEKITAVWFLDTVSSGVPLVCNYNVVLCTRLAVRGLVWLWEDVFSSKLRLRHW